MYEAMKGLQSLVTELWDISFTKEIIEGELSRNVAGWDQGMQNLVSFMKEHQIENKRIRHLTEESSLASKIKKFTHYAEKKFWSHEAAQSIKKIRFDDICLKDEDSFLAIGNAFNE